MSRHLQDEALIAYIHQTLTDAEREAMDRHFMLCKSCRARRADYEQTQRYIRQSLVADLGAIQPPGQLVYANIAPALKQSRKFRRFWQSANRFDLQKLWQKYPLQFAFRVVGVAILVILVMGLVTFFKGLNQSKIVSAPEVLVTTPTLKVTEVVEPGPISISPTISTTTAISESASNLEADFYGIQIDPNGDASVNMEHLDQLGFHWVKFQMSWKDVEPSPGDIQWGRWDKIINAYSGAGIKILLSIPNAPDWARPSDDDKSVEGLPADPKIYARFVGAVAARYAGRVQAIEVWDEQNLYYRAGGPGRVDVDNYMTLLKAAYAAIKAANPDMTVVSGGLTPTGAPLPFAVDDVLYLRQMYERGLKNVSDAIGAHPMGFANPPDALYIGGDYDSRRGFDDHRSFFFRNTMEEYRNVMVEFGDGNKTIWPTEFGWPVERISDSRFDFAKENSLEEQAEYIVHAFEMGQTWGWVGPMFLFNLDYAVTRPNSELANFSILTPEGPTPAYLALQKGPKRAEPLPGNDCGPDQLPAGWQIGISQPENVEFGIDCEVAYSGDGSVYIKSKGAIGGINLFKMIQADAYIGQRIRFSGYIKTEGLGELNWGTLWINLSYNGDTGPVNLPTQLITETTDWQRYELIVDVPENVNYIVLGLSFNWFRGEGQVWMDELRLEVVDNIYRLNEDDSSRE